jgi:regulator of cell morphogenesis and NO signaling
LQALSSNDITLGELASTRPLAVRVFQRRGINFCCAGNKALKAVCQARGLDPAQVLEEISEEEARGESSPLRWDERGLDELVSHLLEHYHRHLYAELARLEELAKKVRRVHGAKDPERLSRLAETVVALRQELEVHLRKEEEVLFPWILSGRGPSAMMPIQMMRAEHWSTSQQLAVIRELTDNFVPAPQACATWRALWQGLEALEVDLLEHMHLENNILFPRALKGA